MKQSFQNWDLLLKEFVPIGVHFFFQELTSFKKKYKNKNGRIASPENVSTLPQMENKDDRFNFCHNSEIIFPYPRIIVD